MIVVDASVAFKWLKSTDEPYHEQALLLLEEHLSGRNKILAPDILFLEIANSLVTKTHTTDATVRANLESLYSFNLEIAIPDMSDILDASMQAKKNTTTVYDMLYAVIAKKYKTILITADERFVSKTKFPFVTLLTHHGMIEKVK